MFRGRAAKAWEPTRRGRCVSLVGRSKLSPRFRFFAMCQPHIHHDQQREHQQGEDRWPLQQETQHDDDEADILRMAHVGIGTRRRQGMLALRLVEDVPGGREKDEAAEDQRIARDVQRTKVGIALEPEEC